MRKRNDANVIHHSIVVYGLLKNDVCCDEHDDQYSGEPLLVGGASTMLSTNILAADFMDDSSCFLATEPFISDPAASSARYMAWWIYPSHRARIPPSRRHRTPTSSSPMQIAR